MATKYPNSGKLSANRYKDNEKKPDVVGELIMTRSALKELMGERRRHRDQAVRLEHGRAVRPLDPAGMEQLQAQDRW